MLVHLSFNPSKTSYGEPNVLLDFGVLNKKKYLYTQVVALINMGLIASWVSLVFDKNSFIRFL